MTVEPYITECDSVFDGWIFVDLAPFVGDSLGMGDDGYSHGWGVIAGAPVRVPIRFNLGKLRHLDRAKARQYFSEAGKASRIEVQGEDAQGIQTLLGVLRGGWDGELHWPGRERERRCVQCNHVSGTGHSAGLPGHLAEAGRSVTAPEVPAWLPADLTGIVNGTYTPPRPEVGMRDDGQHLLYPGRVHTVAGETEAGKSWLLLLFSLQEIQAGHHVCYLDFEDEAGAVTSRLLVLGADPAAILACFHYYRPETKVSRADVDGVLAWQPSLIPVDGVTEAMALHNLEPGQGRQTDISKFNSLLLKPLTRSGAAVLAGDHVTKSKETRGRYALGDVHKLNIVTGSAFMLENKSPFGIGLRGETLVYCTKDRNGHVRGAGQKARDNMSFTGTLILNSKAEEFAEISLAPPADREPGTEPATFRPTVLMERISRYIEDHPGLSGRAITAAVTGKTEVKRLALELLVTEGWITKTRAGTAYLHQSARPYRDET